MRRSPSILARAAGAAAGLAALLLPATVSIADEVSSDCTLNGLVLKGDVQVVDSFPDLKVEIVTGFPDLKVKKVDSFPDDCGEWKFVDSFPDFKIQYVDSFPDLKIEFVDSFPGLP